MDNPFDGYAANLKQGASDVGNYFSSGGGKKAAAPPPQFNGSNGPDTWQNAAQGQSDQSHVNLNGVVGSSGWKQDPNTGQWTESQQLNGPYADAAQKYGSQIAGQGALDLSGLTQLDQGQGQMQKAEDAAYGQATSRLDPQWAQQGEALKSQLASQGLDPGTEAANNAQGNFDRAKNDAYSSAQNYAVGQGLQAQQQAFGQSAMARQQGLAELLQQRQMPFQQLQSLMGMMGSAQGAGSASAPNFLGGVQGQANFNLGNQDMQNKGAAQMWNNIGQDVGTGASIAAMALSDERAKQKIERLPFELIPGVPLAIFEYRHAPRIKRLGVVAQDVLRVAAHAVHERADGLLCVDYAALGRLI